MFIHRRQEGRSSKLGLNWLSNENTILGLTIVLPNQFILPTKYLDSVTDCQYYGWRMRVIRFRLRLRRWKNFETKVKKILLGYSSYITSVGSQQLIATGEMLEDIKLAGHK